MNLLLALNLHLPGEVGAQLEGGLTKVESSKLCTYALVYTYVLP